MRHEDSGIDAFGGLDGLLALLEVQVSEAEKENRSFVSIITTARSVRALLAYIDALEKEIK